MPEEEAPHPGIGCKLAAGFDEERVAREPYIDSAGGDNIRLVKNMAGEKFGVHPRVQDRRGLRRPRFTKNKNDWIGAKIPRTIGSSQFLFGLAHKDCDGVGISR